VAELEVVVYSEGKHEVGGKLDEALAPDDLPALPRIIHRLAGCPTRTKYVCRSVRRLKPVIGKGRKWAKKVIRAIRDAERGKSAAVVVVIDRDRETDAARIDLLRQGRDALSLLAFPPCAVGTAIEAFDAWMIADGKAIKAAGGDPTKGHPAPENLDGDEGTGRHPKDVAARVFSGKTGLATNYAAVAEHLDLALLARACPQGFKPFAAEVRERIGPVVADS